MKKFVVKAGLIGVSVILVLTFVFGLIGFSNDDTGYRNLFGAKFTERTANYDKMWKTISQVGQVAVKNDSSFRKNIDIIMSNRKDAQGILMKWVTESNPNANYDAVAKLYENLTRVIEAGRQEFFNQEKVLQDIKLQDDNLIMKFPGSLYAWILGRKSLVYKPITSDRTDDVIKTGKDNEVKVF